MERVFWNTIAGAISRQGTEFFYSNTLHLRTDHDDEAYSPRRRMTWYECACCPPNLARLMASIQAYLLTRDPLGLQVHMPFSGTVSTEVPGGHVDFAVRTGHPWEGTTGIEMARCSSTETWEMSLRSPAWTDSDALRVTVNGVPVEASLEGSYVRLSRRWHAGDLLQMWCPMPVRVLRPHWRIDAVRGSVAVQRGPLLYCVEAADLDEGVVVEDLVMDRSHPLEPTSVVPADLEGYVKVAIAGSGEDAYGSAGQLYSEEDSGRCRSESLPLTFVPYFARGNRSRDAMRVWVPIHPDHDQSDRVSGNITVTSYFLEHSLSGFRLPHQRGERVQALRSRRSTFSFRMPG